MHTEKHIGSASQSDSSGIWEISKSQDEQQHMTETSPSIQDGFSLERAARRKIDISVLVVLFLGLLVFQLDRMNLASALTGGFAKDISINQSTVNLGNQLMFMSTVVFEIPCNMILQRLGPRKWIAGQVFAFGLTATMQVFVKNRAGFLAVRLMLGFTEAGYIPGSIYTLSTWYTPSELAKKVAIFFFGMFGGNAISPVLASGILRLDGVQGLRGWQWLFLIEGLFTLLVSFIIILCLPHSVDEASPLVGPGIVRLSSAEKELLQNRLAAERGSQKDDEEVMDWQLIWRVVSHYRRWPTYVSAFCVFSTWSPLTTYTPSIIMSLGFERIEANALASVGAFLAIAVVFFFAYVSDRTNLRGGTVISAQICYLICVVVARQVHPVVGKWSRWGLWTAVNSFAVGYHPVSNTWLQLNCRDRRERSIGIAMWVMSSISGLMVGTQYFQANDSPFYHTGLRTIIIMVVIGISFAAFQIGIYMVHNRRVKRKEVGAFGSEATTIILPFLEGGTAVDCGRIPKFWDASKLLAVISTSGANPTLDNSSPTTMGKRASGTSEGAAAYNKRPKTFHNVPTGEDVFASDQLRRLLAFDQNIRNARHGLQSFKNILDRVKSAEADREAKLAIVRGYLESVQPRETGEEAVFLNDIMEMWSFAAQVNDDGVMSSVSVVLALLLQVISDNLDLVPYGLGICQTLLQERQLKSLSRNLSVEKGKGFIISPTLRLLREAVCLDGGAFAKRIFRARASTFASLARNLEVVHVGDGPEDVRKASVRTNAVRFFLSCLKFLNSDGRRELLAQKELLSHVTFMMKNDPPFLVVEIITSLKTNILMDPKIARDTKLRGFNTKTLVRFLGLYTYSNSSVPADDVNEVIEKAHQFLVYACTNFTAGVLYSSKGLYPKESDDESSTSRHASRAKSDGNLWADKFRDGVPVYNFVLSEFASKLRPWSNLKHNELLVAIFQAAPELIADYFFNNRSFTFEPKLSMTWIGYAAFLFNTMTIPLPLAFGDAALYANTPPPTSILLDNIIPQPINQKVLIRCLSPKSQLTSFFATRILVQALEKLSVALKMHEDGGRKKKSIWTDASRRLIDSFCQRIPDMKEVVRCYKSIPAENALHKTLASRLLRLYYEIVPRVALAANFDVSPFFVEVLGSIQNESKDPVIASYAVMELKNLVSIASYSPGMRWFVKTGTSNGGKGYSAFTSLLQILCESDDTAPLAQLQSVLADVAIENQIVAKHTRLVALLRALRCASLDSKTANIPWAYLDNCVTRCAGSPIKYLEQVSTLPKDGQFSLLNIVLQEQLSFALDGANKTTIAEIGKFLSLYFNALSLAGESKDHLEESYSKISEQISATKATKMASLGDKSEKKALQRIAIEEEPESSTSPEAAVQSGVMVDEARLEELLHQDFTLKEDNSALVKWSSKNVEDLVEDGLAAGLVELLASPHTSIRKEALTNILKMAAKINESSYDEKKQVWLLLSELAESSRPLVDAGPVPSSLLSFTAHALDILKNPLHPLYPKINAFLARSPVWPRDKLPMAHDILHGSPGDDDRYYTELAWLLAHLLDSLRTPADLAVFRSKRWFEKILALAANPYLRANLKTRILRIVYRATRIDGGSTTLITRFGVVSWLAALRAGCAEPDDRPVYAALMRRAWETCDQARVTAWSKGGIQKLLETALG